VKNELFVKKAKKSGRPCCSYEKLLNKDWVLQKEKTELI
jgi:hypothetical protein